MGNTCLSCDLLLHYWNSGLNKSNGFVLNRKHEQFVINVVLKTKMIPNSCVMLLTIGGKVALVTPNKHPHKRYWVHKPKFEWTSCDCIIFYRWLCFVGSLKSSFIIVHRVGMKFNTCWNFLKLLNSCDNTSQFHL